MKNILVSLLASLMLAGCGKEYNAKYNAFTPTFFPTNRWKVVSVVEGEVVVEAIGTNLKQEFRVIRAKPVSPLTNGQPVRVELRLTRAFIGGGPKIISAKAYPAVE